MQSKRPKEEILEIEDKETANQLLTIGEYRLERYSEHRNAYILIKRKR